MERTTKVMRKSTLLILSIFLTLVLKPGSNVYSAGVSWSYGLFCESVFPDKKLDNFFLIDRLKKNMTIASFDDDVVSFGPPLITLQKTPKEIVNRKKGLIINRKTLEMKWRNRKSNCKLITVEELKELANSHLNFLLKDNLL